MTWVNLQIATNDGKKEGTSNLYVRAKDVVCVQHDVIEIERTDQSAPVPVYVYELTLKGTKGVKKVNSKKAPNEFLKQFAPTMTTPMPVTVAKPISGSAGIDDEFTMSIYN